MSDPLKEFLDVWGGGYLASDIASKLTCTEAEAIASLFLSVGNTYAAEAWIDNHAESDECGDMHCQCGDCPPEEEMRQAEWGSALAAYGIDPDVLNWVQNGQSATRLERLEAGEITIADIINEERGLS